MDIQKLKNVKLLILDFDGVLTDNKVIVDENGKESVICNRSDSLGLELLQAHGVTVIVISKEKNKVVSARCNKLGIPCTHSTNDKLSILKKEIKERNLSPQNVCFIGNDLPDIECITFVDFGVAVNDAYPEVKKIADFITERNGGDGAVREVVDTILKAKNGN